MVYTLCALICYLINTISQEYEGLRYWQGLGVANAVLFHILSAKIVTWFHVATMQCYDKICSLHNSDVYHCSCDDNRMQSLC